ncbi:MAG: type II toxin-antitoxin system Phd/YefM family antitoxin [Akkermansia sp.]|nr:type II toxin-antitoxin system Phd/YefM family antitoxin [Akkermansia sp.]
MQTLSFTSARQNLAKTIKTCVDDYEPIMIKSRNREVVMIPADQYNSWMETMNQLDSPANIRHIVKSRQEFENGEYSTYTPETLDDLLDIEVAENEY